MGHGALAPHPVETVGQQSPLEAQHLLVLPVITGCVLEVPTLTPETLGAVVRKGWSV